MSDKIPDERVPDEEVRRRLREFSKGLRDLGLIGGPDSPTAEYRASRAIRPDQFLNDVMDRQRERAENEEGSGEDN